MKAKISAAVLSLALMLPAGSALADHSRTRGTIVGAAVGALVGGTKGAVIGGALGNGVQYERNHMEAKSRRHHYRRHHTARYYRR
jgi:phage tail tape-measure protein